MGSICVVVLGDSDNFRLLDGGGDSDDLSLLDGGVVPGLLEGIWISGKSSVMGSIWLMS